MNTPAKNPNIEKLNRIGQSVWYDNLSKQVLDDGSLARLVQGGVSGLTSNPTIFKKAIADSSLYDDAIRKMAKEGLDRDTICEDLMVVDVGRAADLLRSTYDRSNARDGHASIEVSPFLADDTEGTLTAARRIWKKLARPNIMIKVPATPAGLPAIETLLSEGINVNITLIFSCEVYREVAERFIAGLEKRAQSGGQIGSIASVASFFVSRVDSKVEGWLKGLNESGKGSPDLNKTFTGTVGIANSRVAYAAFQEIFEGERFKKLAALGAQVQRPLWASTGTKNPAFSPVLYVEELAAPHTVNTVPPQTLEALMANLGSALWPWKSGATPHQLIESLAKHGANWNKMLLDLQNEGVKLFAESFTDLLSAVSTKMKSN